MIPQETGLSFGQEGQKPNAFDRVPSSVFLLMLFVCSLWLADSVILATARAYDATLWTQDEHFEVFKA